LQIRVFVPSPVRAGGSCRRPMNQADCRSVGARGASPRNCSSRVSPFRTVAVAQPGAQAYLPGARPASVLFTATLQRGAHRADQFLPESVLRGGSLLASEPASARRRTIWKWEMHIWTNPEIKLFCFNNLKTRFVHLDKLPKIDAQKRPCLQSLRTGCFVRTRQDRRSKARASIVPRRSSRASPGQGRRGA
jgi:hypothetical protein